MTPSQPYFYKKWFGILANPDDTVEYLRKGRMPRNTDTGSVEDNPYPTPATPDSSNFRKNFKGKGSMPWMVQDNKPAAEELRQQAPVVSDAKSALKRDTTPFRSPMPTGNAYLDKAYARVAAMRAELSRNYRGMVSRGQAKINEYKRQGNKEAEIWERLRLGSRIIEVHRLAADALLETYRKAGLDKDNPEARKNVLEWQKRVQEEERQRALEATKPTKEPDSRYTQPPPPSAVDKVNKIMNGYNA